MMQCAISAFRREWKVAISTLFRQCQWHQLSQLNSMTQLQNNSTKTIIQDCGNYNWQLVVYYKKKQGRLNEKTFRLKNRSKRRGQNWANQTHKRKEIKFSDHHFLIYTYQICSFRIFRMWRVHIRKMQNLQITFAYIKKCWSENFISFLLCVWLAQFCPRRLDLFFNRKVFSFN